MLKLCYFSQQFSSYRKTGAVNNYDVMLNVCVLLQFLYSSVMVNDFPGVLCAIAHGGNTNYTNKEDESKTPILLAAEAVS